MSKKGGLPRNVGFGSKADIASRPRHVRYIPLKADIHQRGLHVRYVP
jgi:hypothetical protein